MASIVESLLKLDRRWIFLLMTLAIATPMLLKPTPLENPATPLVKDAYASIENLPAGSKLLMAFDYDPNSAPELEPMALAMTWHAAKKGHKLYFLTLWPIGVGQISNVENEIIAKDFAEDSPFRPMVYGEDYVRFGYRIGAELAISQIARSFKEAIASDEPMVEGIEGITDFDLIVSVSAGQPGTKEWIQYAGTPYGVPVVGGCTGVQAPLLYPYLGTQMVGLLGAIKGAAEYETLLLAQYPDYGYQRDADGNRTEARFEKRWKGRERMGPQSMAHFLVVGLIIVGNVLLFTQRAIRGAS